MVEDEGDEQHCQWNLSWVVERLQVAFDDLFPVNLFERFLIAVRGILFEFSNRCFLVLLFVVALEDLISFVQRQN